MIYHFDEFTLDTGRRELRRSGSPVAVEPQVFDLLVYLIEQRHRVVTKADLVERIWSGRAISDWTILGRIKALRRALGDDGATQGFVRTLRSQGFRFVMEVRLRATAGIANPPELDPATSPGGTPPCIAVLPFTLIGEAGPYPGIADAVPRELIRSLSSLRWLKVIAHGSSFRFRGETVELDQVRSLLGAQYCLSGDVEIHAGRLVIDVDLADTRSGLVVWATRRAGLLDDVQQLRSEIAASVVNVAELEIPQHEASLLDVDGADNLDAWSALHLGFREVYRLNPAGAEAGARLFERSIALEPTLARAHAGLSFARFQRVFLGYSSDMGGDRRAARAAAEHSVELQPRDPFANVVMGRSFWLEGDPEGSKPWFDRAIRESPNYAFARYASSWASVFTADYRAGSEMTDQAIALSPLDPMRSGMLCNKMWMAIAAQDHESAVRWAERTVLTPGSHAGHAFFAAMSSWLAGDTPAVQRWLVETRRRNPEFSRANASALVPAAHREFSDMVQRAAVQLGL